MAPSSPERSESESDGAPGSGSDTISNRSSSPGTPDGATEESIRSCDLPIPKHAISSAQDTGLPDAKKLKTAAPCASLDSAPDQHRPGSRLADSGVTDDSAEDTSGGKTDASAEKDHPQGAPEDLLSHFLESKELLTADKIERLSKTNIFEAKGRERVKKPSPFLNTGFVKQLQKPAEQRRGNIFAQSASLHYWEDGEWVHMCEGEAQLSNERFVFIRSSLNTVLLNFAHRGAEFAERDGSITFHADSKMSTEQGLQTVNRKYKLVLVRDGAIKEFLDVVNRARERTPDAA